MRRGGFDSPRPKSHGSKTYWVVNLEIAQIVKRLNFSEKFVYT